jgi:hypothetical protein
MFSRKTGLLLCGILACALARADPLVPITMHYFERKPLHYLNENGKVSGILVNPIEQSFIKAGIPLVWRQTPVNRIMATLKANDGLDCAAGFYKSPEREAIARFSLPFYHDKGLVALSRPDFVAPSTTTAHELLARQQTRLVVKQGFVYGRYLDPLIEKMSPAQVQHVSDEIDSIVRMVGVGAADIVFVTEEEAEIYLNPVAAVSRNVRLLHLSDVPAQEYRYIACSKQVPQQVMDKLNAAIATLPLDGAHNP